MATCCKLSSALGCYSSLLLYVAVQFPHYLLRLRPVFTTLVRLVGIGFVLNYTLLCSAVVLVVGSLPGSSPSNDAHQMNRTGGTLMFLNYIPQGDQSYKD